MQLVEVIIDTPVAAMGLANAALIAHKKQGYTAGRIEFAVWDASNIVIAIKYKKALFPKLKQVTVTADPRQWDGAAAANHPVLNVGGILWFCGVQ